MVQLTGEAILDARPGDHRADLADSLPDNLGQFWVRVRAGDQEEAPVAGGAALRRQPSGEPYRHADSIRDAKPAAGSGRYSDRLGDNNLDVRGDLAAPPLGGCCPSAVLCLGVAGDCAATVNHLDEFGTIMILGFSQTTITQVMASELVDSTHDTISDN